MVKLNINDKDEKIVGEFIGAFAGDGNYFADKRYRHVIRIYANSKDQSYVQHLSDLVLRLTGRRPWTYTREKEHVTELRIISKRVYDLISRYLSWGHNKTLTLQLREIDQNGQFWKGFLKGLLDTDGHMGARNATFSTISKKLSENIRYALMQLNVSCRVYNEKDTRNNRKEMYRIRISEDFNKLARLIEPHHFNYLHTKSIRALVV